jgi:hypothetical protein
MSFLLSPLFPVIKEKKMSEELQKALKKAKMYLLYRAVDGQDFDLAEVARLFAEPEDQELLSLLEDYTSPGGKFETELEFTRWRVNKWRSSNA